MSFSSLLNKPISKCRWSTLYQKSQFFDCFPAVRIFCCSFTDNAGVGKNFGLHSLYYDLSTCRHKWPIWHLRQWYPVDFSGALSVFDSLRFSLYCRWVLATNLRLNCARANERTPLKMFVYLCEFFLFQTETTRKKTQNFTPTFKPKLGI